VSQPLQHEWLKKTGDDLQADYNRIRNIARQPSGIQQSGHEAEAACKQLLMLLNLKELDVREVLPTIRVPTLVVHHTDDPIVAPAIGKYVADHIPGAKYIELPGRNVWHFVEPWRESFQEIAEFLTGESNRT
jgi:pimeloyl-ACP methyl ester carboxylesterase